VRISAGSNMLNDKQIAHLDRVREAKEENQGYEYDIYTDLQAHSGGLEGMEEEVLPDSATR